VPHITNEIQQWIERVAHVPVEKSGDKPEICVIELGGTVSKVLLCVEDIGDRIRDSIKHCSSVYRHCCNV
jgi:CTP synthase (UTP-ammonia lyase)